MTLRYDNVPLQVQALHYKVTQVKVYGKSFISKMYLRHLLTYDVEDISRNEWLTSVSGSWYGVC